MDERVFMSLGILKVAAVLEQYGHIVEVLDLSGITGFEAAAYDHAKQTDAKIFGITATTPQMPAVTQVVRVLREARPEARIILGGPHVTLVAAALKREKKLGMNGRATRAWAKLESMFDTLVTGDGEDAIFVALDPNCDKWVDADQPSSRLFLTNDKLNQTPWPARHLVDVSSYKYSIENHKALSLLAQVGCPFNCGFCGGRESPMLRRIRTRTTENIVREVVHLHTTYGVTGMMFYDDELNVNPLMISLMNDLSEAQDRLGVEFRMRGFIKSQLFTDEQAQAMYRAGFRWILVGFECLAGDTQIFMDSGETTKISDAIGNAVAINKDRKVIRADSVLINQGKQLPMLKVSTGCREITASHRHRFFKFCDGDLEERETSRLAVGDWVAVCAKASGFGSQTMSNERAQLAGFFLGDGSLGLTPKSSGGRVLRFRLFQKERPLLELYAGLVASEFGHIGSFYRGNRATWVFTSLQSSLTEWASLLRAPGKDGFKVIPDLIMKGNDQIIARFLRGYFDAEGTVNTQDKKITVVCKHRRPIEQVKHLLMRLGIHTARIVKSDYENKCGQFTQYMLTIGQQTSIRRYAEVVGFSHKERNSRLSRILASRGRLVERHDYLPFSKEFLRKLAAGYSRNFRKHRNPILRCLYGKGRAPRRRDLAAVLKSLQTSGHALTDEAKLVESWLQDSDVVFERIESVTDAGVVRAYDLHVPVHHTYVANGFMVHNSGSEQVLEAMNKKATRVDNTRCMEIAKRNGLKVKALMSMGHPGESEQTVHDTKNWLLEVQPDDFDITVITTYSGTPYHDFAVETKPGVWTYTYPKTGEKLHAVEIDHTEEAGFYKGKPGEYTSFVFTDYLSPEQIVRLRDELEADVRAKLNIPFNQSAAALKYEHSMGQGLPDYILRTSNANRIPL